jgi:hypothetical protein
VAVTMTAFLVVFVAILGPSVAFKMIAWIWEQA